MELAPEVKKQQSQQLAGYVAMLNEKINPYPGVVELAQVCYIVPNISLDSSSVDDLFFDYPYNAVADELNKILNQSDSYLDGVNELAIQRLGETENGYIYYEYSYRQAPDGQDILDVFHMESNIEGYLDDKIMLLDYLRIIDCSMQLERRKSYNATINDVSDAANKSNYKVLTLCQKRLNDEKPHPDSKPNILICSFKIHEQLRNIALVTAKLYNSLYTYLGFYFNSPVLPSIFQKRQELHQKIKANEFFLKIINNYGHTIFNMFPPIIAAINDIKKRIEVKNPLFKKIGDEVQNLRLTNIIFKIIGQGEVSEFNNKDGKPKTVVELIDLLNEFEVRKKCTVKKLAGWESVDYRPNKGQMEINDVFNILWNFWHNARKCSEQMLGVDIFNYEDQLAITFYNDSKTTLDERNLAFLLGENITPVSTRGEKGGLTIIRNTMDQLGWRAIANLSSVIKLASGKYIIKITIITKP